MCACVCVRERESLVFLMQREGILKVFSQAGRDNCSDSFSSSAFLRLVLSSAEISLRALDPGEVHTGAAEDDRT